METKTSNDTMSQPFLTVADTIAEAVFAKMDDEKAVERSIDTKSQLAIEIRSAAHPTSHHFLTELPKHCVMLATALQDACRALEQLNPELPFSCTVLVRGLMEAGADLYWLTDTRIDAFERTRRTFLVYLIQVETQLRQLRQYRDRVSDEKERSLLDAAIKEGWAYLRQTAENMASAGYRLRTSRKPGVKYFLDEQKPSINSLVDGIVKELYGVTALNLYSVYSSTAHVEGEGLGGLMDVADVLNTGEGAKYAYGFDDKAWLGLVVRPAIRIAVGATRMWLELGHPRQLKEFDSKTANLFKTLDR
jgi:hypothetical protein